MQAELFPVGDCALLAVCGSKIDEGVGDKVSALDGAVHAANLPGVVETVPAFASLLVRYDPCAPITTPWPPPWNPWFKRPAPAAITAAGW